MADKNDARELAEKISVFLRTNNIGDFRSLPHKEAFVVLCESALTAYAAALTQERDALRRDLEDAKQWKREFDMYRSAWIRELGGWLIPKSHEIDSLVLTTRARCVNPLLGNCRVPHWLGKPTSNGKALQQTAHPRESNCRDWKADSSETAARAAAEESQPK